MYPLLISLITIIHGSRITASPPWLPPVAATKPQPTGFLEPLLLRGVNDTLRRRGGVPQSVIAIWIVHETLAEPPHGKAAVMGDDGVVCGFEVGMFVVANFTAGDFLDGINRATLKGQVLEFWHKRCIFVVDFVFSAGSGPIWGIPYGSVQWHWLWRIVSTHFFTSYHFSNWDFINVESE